MYEFNLNSMISHCIQQMILSGDSNHIVIILTSHLILLLVKQWAKFIDK